MSTPTPTADQTRFGILCAVAAQLCWGFFPLYVYFLKSIDSFSLVAHRAIWSLALLAGVLFFARNSNHFALPKIQEFKLAIRDGPTLRMFALAAVLIGINWIGFVWAVTHDRALDASLGYYICPQVVVLLGVVFQNERLRVVQWIAVGLASFGVAYMGRSATGIPWLAIAIALSFGFYGLVKKRVAQTALTGLTLETGFLFIPALIFLGYQSTQSDGSVFGSDWLVNVFLIGSGLATVTPLALYATALKHIPLSTSGLLQFMGPTIQFFVGVFIFSEQFDHSRLIGFLFVWTGVALYLFAMRRTQLEQNEHDTSA